MNKTAVALLIAGLLATSACTSGSETASLYCTPESTPALGLADKGLQGPPVAKVSVDGCHITVGAFEYTWGNSSGGANPGTAPRIKATDKIAVSAAGAKSLVMTSRLVARDGTCSGPEFDGHVSELADGQFEVSPGGPVGMHRAIVEMKSDGGTAKYAFDWMTTASGPVREPLAHVGAVLDRDGHVDLNGQFMIRDIADVRVPIAATTDITSADGKTERVNSMIGSLKPNCFEDPAVYLIRTEAPPGSHPGIAPYTYDVVLTINGSEYRASSTWDVGDPREMTLEFTPPLPRPSPRSPVR